MFTTYSEILFFFFSFSLSLACIYYTDISVVEMVQGERKKLFFFVRFIRDGAYYSFKANVNC